MKNLFVLTILVLAVAGVFGQENAVFRGTILDESLKPVFGATVQVENTPWGAVANEKGVFEISLPNPGTYDYIVSFIGFEKVIGRVDLQRGENPKVMIALKASPFTMDELLVSAIKVGSNSPFAHTNMEKEELKAKNVASDLPVLLESMPSIVSTSENGTGFGYSNFRIRGTDISRINVTMNGVPLNDSESQGVFWVNMPDFASSVEGIQVQRGVGTSSNGAAAFGASVNFSTLGVDDKPYFEYQSMGGSFATFKNTVMAGTGLLKSGFNLDVRYSKLNSDGYIKRGFTDHQSFFGSAGWRNKNTLLKAVALIGQEKTGITWWGVPDYMLDTDRRFNPAGEYTDDEGNTQYFDGQTDNYWQNHYQLMGNHSFTPNLSLNLALHATTGEGYYQQYKTEEDLLDYGFEGMSTNTDLIRQKWLDNVFYGFNAALNYQNEYSRLAFGTAYTLYDGDHYGLVTWLREGNQETDLEWYRNTGVKKDINAFAKADYRFFDNLWVFGDLQMRNIQYEMEGPDDDLVDVDQNHDWIFFNPKAGISYKIDDVKIYGSFAIANREPTRADLKDATKNDGDVLPSPETLFDTEAGVVWSAEKASFSANFYYMSYKDQLVNTGYVNSVGYPVMTNVDQSYRLGIEFAWKIVPMDFVSWEANTTLSNNKIKDYYDDVIDAYRGKTNISYSPSFIAGSDIALKANDWLSVHLINKYVGKQYFDNTSSEDRKIDPYHFMNVRADIGEFDIWKAKLGFQLMVNNIYNAQYSNNAYGGYWLEDNEEMTWKYYFPQAGTNFAIKAVLRF